MSEESISFSGGSASFRIPSSRSSLIRDFPQALLTILPISPSLPSISQPRRNNPNDFHLIPLFHSVSDVQEDHSSNSAEHLPSQFAIHHTVLLDHSVRIVKDLDSIIEADPVLPQIALGLRLVPLK